MIDPKFNDLTENTPAGSKDLRDTGLDSGAKPGGTAKPRAGLSINETIAADANLSVGSRGADTSGVRAGAGAAAGGSHLSPIASESPAPNFVPGSRGSGTTPLADSPYGHAPAVGESSQATVASQDSSLAHTAAEPLGASTSDTGSHTLSYDEIAAHAYRCWHERGCPEGSPEHDWQRAEQELRERRAQKVSTATA